MVNDTAKSVSHFGIYGSNMFVKLYRIKEQPNERFERLFSQGTKIGNKLREEEIVQENYNLLFSGEIPDGDLEHIFNTLNTDTGYGMYVSDVVEIIASAHIEPGFYFCDNLSFWTKVTW